MTHLDARAVRRRFLAMVVLRYLPSGLLMPILVLLPLERGLSLPEIGVAVAAQGFVVLLLEVPTGGLSDALGRKPVLLLAMVVSLGSITVMFFADSLGLFMVAYLLQGVYRALESGPLEAWFVDATLAHDPPAAIERGLAAGGVAIGVAVGAGSLLSGGLIMLNPLEAFSPLELPVLAALALRAVDLLGVFFLMVEVRAARGFRAVAASVAKVPRLIRESIGLLRRSRVLLTLVSVELFWGFGMVTFEALMPVRLTELVASPQLAASILGPLTAVAWLASAGGSAVVTRASRRFGIPQAAAALRILQGLTVVGMGLFAGPAGLIAAYLACYVVHGASNPLHMTLLHEQVESTHRTTVVSLNSMVAQPAGAIGGIALTALAGATSVSVAMLAGGVILAMAAPLYLPSIRARRVRPQPPALLSARDTP